MANSVEVSKQPTQIPLLTGLRGMAASIVLISHAAIVGMLPSILGHGFGQVGVMIFFVLSGFLMTFLYIQRIPNKKNISSYLRARVGRVVPLYLIVVVVSVVVSNFLYREFRYSLPLADVGQILQALFFVQAPWELWTIPVEVQFYAVFVLAWMLYPKMGKGSVLLVGAAVTLPAIVYLGLWQAKPSILPTYGFAFFLGAVLAVYLPQLKRLLAGRLPGFLGAAFLVLLFVNLPGLRDEFHLSIAPGSLYISTWLDPITWVIVAGLFVCCLVGSTSLKMFDSRVFIFLGNISYGLYLLHYPILEITARFVGTSIVGLFVGCGASIGLAWLSYRYFERPVMALIRGSRRSRFIGAGEGGHEGP
ncbi:acyltransferase family protein [Mycolicibacterium fluoranthenivorans]|uniref:Peptidoglycan/LPS O-acetylase OafA/YrhL, contains acyltransferase and SGNH-hydrolase domains n=1 Tax=Mycolicibacterium fluoranthenivorans TaxID=258505 RepID=A0A1G4WWE9_9MYCO|nr:acyltransferase [Mycolicibacterium fluoranthenivorans]SCX30457.1 Peptidoglycan/LPS O-acetylase OafA/YrhL, contains acyltransferase and SGNH-hydrolase domains [Mycolicibacterium fluoranthenivorans]